MTDTQAKNLRLALVGAGGLGRGWAKIISTIPGATLAAIVDPLVDTDRQSPWVAEDFPDIRRARDIADTSPMDLDGIVVTAFSTAHFEVVSKALELGLHVLVEKPFTTTMADAEALVALAERKGLTLMVSQNYRFFPGARTIRDMVADRRYGNIAAVACEFNLDWAGKPYQHGMQHAMGLEMAVHHFDMVRALFDAEAVGGYVREWQQAGSQYAGGGAIEALFDMDGKGGAFPFTYSGNLVSKAPRTPWPGRWRFEFDTKTVLLDTFDGRYGLYTSIVDSQEWIGPYDGPDMSFNLPLSHFIECVGTGKEPWSSGRNNLGTLKMALGAEYFGRPR